ncbi:MAG: hypothetical protein FD152_1983 [Xanthobacteraceae bacterium]|nr:MAG: hypothetical protein FD152_1983 [Xanthobacteraceae bacterium]
MVAPGDPAQARGRRETLVDAARAIRLLPLFGPAEDLERRRKARQVGGRHADQIAIGAVGEGDGPGRVAADDQVALGIDQAAMALLALGEFEHPVGQRLDRVLQRCRLAQQGAASMGEMEENGHAGHAKSRETTRKEGESIHGNSPDATRTTKAA